MHCFDRWQLVLLAVGRQHGAEGIGGGKSDIGKRRVAGRVFHPQRVFEFVREFREFAIAAGGGIPFQGMHGAADAAHRLHVSGSLFELERLFVERLQQLLRAFEKEFA